MEPEINIDSNLCNGCKTCTEVCPNGIFTVSGGKTVVRTERAALCFKCGHCMAACPEKAVMVKGLDYDMDFFDLPESINSFDTLISTRRSVRSFRDLPVPQELLEQVVSAINYAPLSFPPVKTEVTVISDSKLIREALPMMVTLYDGLLHALRNPVARQFVRLQSGKDKYNVIRNHIVPMFNLKMPFMKSGAEDAITRNCMAMIMFHAKRQADNYVTDIYIAMTYALLKAHALGLGATAIDLIPPAVERTPELKRLFKIPAENEVVASIILGYPRIRYKRGIKRTVKSLTWI